MQRFFGWFTGLYAVWLVCGAVAALWQPATFTWFTGPWITGALSLVMLSMGFTLTLDDFKRLLKMPGSLALGFLAHYTIMPLTGWLIARMLGLDSGFAVGLILVACCPSGTASNVVSLLARADVALAVAVTTTSTLLAFLMTPIWCQFLAGRYVPVDAIGLSLSTLQIVVAPVLIGVLCNVKFPGMVAAVSRFGPPVSVVALVMITCGIVSQNAQAVIANAGRLAVGATLLHVVGFGLGYVVARVLRYPEQVARTISIEVGMQNGGLAVALAKKNFVTEPLAAVPAVFSSVIQNIIGGLLATWWRARQPKTDITKMP
ncbi:MAG: bile acid:sodium symporter family protein [Prosthecobacter sp.]|nr:bile acid:sodium symporter family protein [Prosthecobacter sp.]